LPGALSSRVSRHLKIDTDERGSCRPNADGRCVDSDDIFSLAVGADAALSHLPMIG
jgi:hypothetical protein